MNVKLFDRWNSQKPKRLRLASGTMVPKPIQKFVVSESPGSNAGVCGNLPKKRAWFHADHRWKLPPADATKKGVFWAEMEPKMEPKTKKWLAEQAHFMEEKRPKSYSEHDDGGSREEVSGLGGIRTRDLSLAKRALLPLNYQPARFT
jgi:hypothetical protein